MSNSPKLHSQSLNMKIRLHIRLKYKVGNFQANVFKLEKETMDMQTT